MRARNLLKRCVSEICIKPIRVNQVVGVCFVLCFRIERNLFKNITAWNRLWYSKNHKCDKSDITLYFCSCILFSHKCLHKTPFNTQCRACLHRCASMRVHYGLADIWHGQAAYSKLQQTKILVTCQRFGDLFLFELVWQYSSVQTK